MTFKMILNHHNIPEKYSPITYIPKRGISLIPALFVEKSSIKIMVNKCRRAFWIYGKLDYFHQFDFRGFYYVCLLFILNCLVLYFFDSVNFNRFDHF